MAEVESLTDGTFEVLHHIVHSRGNAFRSQETLGQTDPTMVLFYAPWCVNHLRIKLLNRPKGVRIRRNLDQRTKLLLSP